MKRRIVCIISFILFLVTVILITNDNKYFDNYIINLFKYKSDINNFINSFVNNCCKG